MCSFFCPTGALGKQERGDQVTITFQPDQCTACGLCCDICYQDAVEFSEPTLELIIEDGAQTLWQGRLLSPQERTQQAMAQIFESSSREISREQ
jgi:Fe-S-cluster-containing hydrogenase component 2